MNFWPRRGLGCKLMVGNGLARGDIFPAGDALDEPPIRDRWFVVIGLVVSDSLASGHDSTRPHWAVGCQGVRGLELRAPRVQRVAASLPRAVS